MASDRPHIEIASHETDFFMRFERLQAPRVVFEDQGEAHGDIDLRLVELIEELLDKVGKSSSRRGSRWRNQPTRS